MAIIYNSGVVNIINYNGSPVRHLIYNNVEVPFGPKPTELDLVLTANDLTQTIYYTQSAANAVTVDWGDNSAPSSSADLTANVSHTYASAWDYAVKIYCEDGETWTPGHSATVGLLGPNSETTIGTEFAITIESPCEIVASSAARLKNHVGLTRAVIHAGATVIPAQFFMGDTSLAEADLPSSITMMLMMNFDGCTALEQLTVRAETPPAFGLGALRDVPADCAIYVLSGSVSAYQAASGWSERAAYIQAKP